MKRNIDIIKNENEFFPQNLSLDENEPEIEHFSKFNISFQNDIKLETFLSEKLNGLNDFINNNEESQIENKKEDSNKIREKENIQGIEEIIEIIRRAWGDKTFRIKNSPFKRLIKPKKFSLTGRILLMADN